ncbi:MAG: FMN-binding protein [Eubacterium sp.]
MFPDAAQFTFLDGFSAETAKEWQLQRDIPMTPSMDVYRQLTEAAICSGMSSLLRSQEGYGGDIALSIGVTMEGVVNGYSITAISDTAGLGMKAREEAFSSQYANKQVEKFTVTKTGATSEDQIDAISGATISSNSVTNAVNAGSGFLQKLSSVEGGNFEMNKCVERLTNGIIKENPTFVLLLVCVRLLP